MVRSGPLESGTPQSAPELAAFLAEKLPCKIPCAGNFRPLAGRCVVKFLTLDFRRRADQTLLLRSHEFLNQERDCCGHS